MNRLVLLVISVLSLCTAVNAQVVGRPLPNQSPYYDMETPSPGNPGCALDKMPDPACLKAALTAYETAATAAIDQADSDWVDAANAYDAAIVSIRADYFTCTAACSDQACYEACDLIAYNESILAYDNFNQMSDAIFAIAQADITIANEAYQAAILLCCVDSSNVTPELDYPTLPICDNILGQFSLLCAENEWPDPVCEAACKASYDASISALCATENAVVQNAFVTLYIELDVALNTLTATTDNCQDQACVVAALNTYNATVQDLWASYYDVYLDAVARAKDKQLRLMGVYIQCVQACCDNNTQD